MILCAVMLLYVVFFVVVYRLIIKENKNDRD